MIKKDVNYEGKYFIASTLNELILQDKKIINISLIKIVILLFILMRKLMNMKGLKMLKKLTEKYINAFNKKDIKEVANLLNENFVLEDPVVKRIEGKEECLKAIENIFKNCNKLSFSAKNIFQDKIQLL